MRMLPNYRINPTRQLSQPKTKNSNIKVIAIVSLFVLFFIILMMVMLAGSNPLSHKTGFINNNVSGSKPTNITTNTSNNASNDGDNNKFKFSIFALLGL